MMKGYLIDDCVRRSCVCFLDGAHNIAPSAVFDRLDAATIRQKNEPPDSGMCGTK